MNENKPKEAKKDSKGTQINQIKPIIFKEPKRTKMNQVDWPKT